MHCNNYVISLRIITIIAFKTSRLLRFIETFLYSCNIFNSPSPFGGEFKMLLQKEKLIEIADNLRDVRTALDDELFYAKNDGEIQDINWRYEEIDKAITIVTGVAHDKGEFVSADEQKANAEDSVMDIFKCELQEKKGCFK